MKNGKGKPILEYMAQWKDAGPEWSEWNGMVQTCLLTLKSWVDDSDYIRG